MRRIACLFVSVVGPIVGTSAQTYYKTLGQPGRSEKGLTVHHAPDGKLYIGGMAGDSALVMRIDTEGSVVWARKFRPPGHYAKHVAHLNSTIDGDIIGCGNSIGPEIFPSGGFHFRMDTAGNMLWATHWNDTMMYNKRIVPLNTNEYLIFGTYYDMGSASFSDKVTARVDAATGNLNWVSDRMNLYGPIPYIDNIYGVTTLNGGHYATGDVFTNGAPLSTVRIALSRYSYDGRFDWGTYLIYPNNMDRRMYGADIESSDDSLVIAYTGNINGSNSSFSMGLIRLDTLGNVAWGKDYDIAGSSEELSSKVFPTPFGYVLAGHSWTTGFRRLFLMGVSKTGRLLWARSYGPTTQTHGMENPYAVNLAQVGTGFLLTCYVERSANDHDIVLVRTDGQGRIACGEIQDVNVSVSDLPTGRFNPFASTAPVLLSHSTAQIDTVSTRLSDACASELSLGNDTSACGPLVLRPGIAGATYLWSTGSTGSTLTVDSSGVYWVRATINCCVLTDTIRIVRAPDPTPLRDQMVCPGRDAVISVTGPVAGILWNTGDTTRSITAPTGTYWYMAVDTSGCVRSDTVRIAMDPWFEDTILLPNVITPNGDGRNEMFTVFGAAREGFRLTVFNRWGMELFTTTDPKRGWMGKAGTDPVPEGTYYYVTTYRDPCGGTDGTISQQGHVTVLR